MHSDDPYSCTSFYYDFMYSCCCWCSGSRYDNITVMVHQHQQAQTTCATTITKDAQPPLTRRKANELLYLDISTLKTFQKALQDCDFYRMYAAKPLILQNIDNVVEQAGDHLTREVKDAIKLFYRAQTYDEQYRQCVKINLLLRDDRRVGDIEWGDNIFLFQPCEPVNFYGYTSSFDISSAASSYESLSSHSG